MKLPLLSGGIIANYKCPASCGHCLYGCSPEAEPGYMDEVTASDICANLRRFNCRGLHIGGGEPFLNIDGLIKLIGVIRKSGINVDYIETNAAWITENDENNRQIIHKVIKAGGECVMVSADPFHVEFIPFWKTRKLISLLRGMNIQYFVWQERYLPFLGSLDSEKTYDSQAVCAVAGYDIIRQCAGEYGMGFNGRALNLLRKYGKKKAFSVSSEPCAELCNTNHFHVDFLGRYIPPRCTGMGLLLEDVGKELDDEKYPVMSVLVSGGLEGLLNYASKLGYKPDPDGYFSKCELCFEIRKYLFFYDRQAYTDLTPGSFYEQDF